MRRHFALDECAKSGSLLLSAVRTQLIRLTIVSNAGGWPSAADRLPPEGDECGLARQGAAWQGKARRG